MTLERLFTVVCVCLLTFIVCEFIAYSGSFDYHREIVEQCKLKGSFSKEWLKDEIKCEEMKVAK